MEAIRSPGQQRRNELLWLYTGARQAVNGKWARLADLFPAMRFYLDAPLTRGAGIRDFSMRSLSRARRSRVNRQRNLLAKCGLQTFDGASLIAAARDTTDAYGADHLPVDNDRDAARTPEEIKKDGRTRQARRVILELRLTDGGGLPRFQSCLRFEQRGTHVVGDLSIHALHVHELSGVVDDV
jgi:hypothetical protein